MDQLINSPITEFLLKQFPWYLIGLWTIYAILCLSHFKIRKWISNYYIIETIPNVFVTLGLFGTFTGIAYGLLHFDTTPDNIKNSIGILLNGLKSAMFTSIVGIILSLIFSNIIKVLINSKRIKEPQSPELIELENINRNFIELKDTIVKDHHEVIINSFKEVFLNFNEVFKNFIDDLVKSNFQELNQTINELSTWQRENKEEIKVLKNAYEELVTQHKKFTDTTIVWVNRLDEISGQSSKLQHVIDQFNSAFNEDGNLSRMMQDVESTTSELVTATRGFSTLITKMNDTTHTIAATGQSINEWTQSIESVSNTASDIVATVQSLRSIDANKLNGMLASIDSLFLKYIEDLENRLDRIN